MLTAIIMLVPTLVGAITVVWKPTNRARDHEMLSRKYYGIAKEIDVENVDQEKIKKWRKKMLGIYEDEPAVYHALNAVCYNAVTQALGYDKDKFQQVARWRYHLRNWFRFSAKDFPLVET